MLSTVATKYHGPVEKWRKSSSPVPSIMITFDDVTAVSFSSVCKALRRKFDQTTLGTMYMRQRKGRGMRIEAQVPVDRERREIIQNSLAFGSMSLNIARVRINFKTWPTLPHEPRYRVFRVEGLPLQSEVDVCRDVYDGASRRLSELAKCRGCDKDHLVDVVPGYDAHGGIPLFDGTVSIVLHGVGDFGSKNYFDMNGTRVNAGSSTTHYAYCKGCRSLDSHRTEDCPFPMHNRDPDDDQCDTEDDDGCEDEYSDSSEIDDESTLY
ncbi:hypothetical protein BJV82DRAFT_637181 [Fennellomyces sp. T-0311]|nr:hypothetical protein BJV82DRAFT_637181 [Fennellomyces sp. T-0311]